ncbi:50S ribosomal protein L25 [bacterium]|nr:50S ribosomal protein L25 [bacterium]MBU1984717.1 50S ribosomal protein L25 [bacterium]
MTEIRIRAQVRQPSKQSGRTVRQAGMVPGVYYSRGGDVRCLQFNRDELQHLLRQEIGVLHVEVDGEDLLCIIREVQRHPVRRDVLHIDLMGVVKGQKIRSRVPVHVVGTAKGIKEGGTLDLVMREIEVECVPMRLPTHIDVDVSELGVGGVIRLGDIHLLDVMIHGDPQTTIAHIIPPRAVVEVTPEVAAAPAEPEVIRERKAEEASEEK